MKRTISKLAAIATLGLFTASVFTHLKTTHETGNIEQVKLYRSYDGVFLPSCHGAKIGDAIITASHCFGKTPNPTELYIQENGKYSKIPDVTYRGLYNGFDGYDIAISGDLNFNHVGSCYDQARFIGTEETCDLALFRKKSSRKLLSTQCYLPQGQSGTVLVDKDNKACLVYSGFYDIINNNKKHKINLGVFTPIKEINNEQITRSKTP
ncbi:hypothetical protein LMH73_012275 [Vibrio splendidus]|nr:hypothetical protein [Vibrio splendidus]MCC4880414.1 hypothetical protein [Vibrio splendidus]